MIFKESLIYLALIFLVLISVAVMFFVTYHVKGVRDEIAVIDKQIVEKENDLHILEAEWIYLTRPARIETLAKKYLKNVKHVKVRNIKSLDRLKPYYLVKNRQYKEKNNALALAN